MGQFVSFEIAVGYGFKLRKNALKFVVQYYEMAWAITESF